MGFTVTVGKDEFKTVDAPSRLDPGWYRAVLDDAVIPDGKDEYQLVWKCNHGPFAGAKIHDYLSSPSAAAGHSDGGEFAMKRIKGLAKRMGLLKEGQEGEMDFCFENCIGLEFAIRVLPDTILDPADPRGKKRIPDPMGKTKLDPMGVYPFTHEGIPPAERVKMGLELLPGQVLPAGDGTKVAAAKKKPAGAANGTVPPVVAANADSFLGSI